APPEAISSSSVQLRSAAAYRAPDRRYAPVASSSQTATASPVGAPTTRGRNWLTPVWSLAGPITAGSLHRRQRVWNRLVSGAGSGSPAALVIAVVTVSSTSLSKGNLACGVSVIAAPATSTLASTPVSATASPTTESGSTGSLSSSTTVLSTSTPTVPLDGVTRRIRN